MTMRKRTTLKTAEVRAASPRPFRTSYPGGLRQGYCKSVQSALEAAYGHLVRNEDRKCTITGPDEKDVARLTWTPLGVMTWCPTIVAERPKLRRVK